MAGTRRENEKRGAPLHGEEPAPGLLPDLLRRVLALGFSGFFMTEATLRRALSDSLPKEWIDFAVDQSERTRDEFLERLAGEIARSAESIDLAALAEHLLEGHTIEVKAEVRFRREGGKAASRPFDFQVTRPGRRR